MIRCGHCHLEHETVADVRACSEHRQGTAQDAESFLGVVPEYMAKPTEAKLKYAHDLLNWKEHNTGHTHEQIDTMTKEGISRFISTFKGMPSKGKPRPENVRNVDIKVGEGTYFFEGHYYRVIKAVHGNGRLYVRRWWPKVQAFHYGRTTGVLALLRPEHALTQEQAQEFGALYGVCAMCGRTLTDTKSIAAGIGPVCAGKRGWSI